MKRSQSDATACSAALRIGYGLFGLGLATLWGCTLSSGASQSSQSHFVFPNSNVVPIGEARGATSKLCGILIINIGYPDGDDQNKATREALDKASGDVLLNVRVDTHTTQYGLFSLCTTQVNGTAAKMEVGRQQLSAMSQPTPPPPSPAAPRSGGCASDQDCKAGRLCKEGACVSP